MSTQIQLHSERAGRPRQLGFWDFASLAWRRIARARDYHWLFKGSLEPYRGLGPEDELPRITDPEEFFLTRLRFGGLCEAILRDKEPPTPLLIGAFDLDVLLDLIELLHAEIVAKPIMVHPPDCLDIEGFDREAGQTIFRDEMNEVLPLANPPLELLPNGQVVERSDEHRDLYTEPLPADSEVEAEVADPVNHALQLFLSRGATIEDKRSAVKQLADVLEHLRPEVKTELFSADEQDLFRIANTFAIRHNKPDQQRKYDKEIWLDWMFHVFLATIRAVVAVRDRPA